MGYFKAQVEGNFKRLDDGRIAVFPWGILGSGRIVSPEQAEKLKKFWLKLYFIQIPGAVLFGISILTEIKYAATILGLSFLAVTVTLVIYYVRTHHLLKGTEQTQEKQSMRDRWEASASAMGMRTAVLGLCKSIVMIVIDFVVAMIYDLPNGLFVVVFVVFVSIVINCANSLYFHIRQRSRQ
jgi:hypothetical protein